MPFALHIFFAHLLVAILFALLLFSLDVSIAISSRFLFGLFYGVVFDKHQNNIPMVCLGAFRLTILFRTVDTSYYGLLSLPFASMLLIVTLAAQRLEVVPVVVMRVAVLMMDQLGDHGVTVSRAAPAQRLGDQHTPTDLIPKRRVATLPGRRPGIFCA